ncbi:MAG: TatD family hydrolase [Victivallaceae bacterium]|nr:TatD family hydrolase [Victivallaceae bacterium]
MILFDTHFHIGPEETPSSCRAKIDAALERAAGTLPATETLFTVAVGGSFAESMRAMHYAQSRADAAFAAGVHPHEAVKYRETRDDFSVFRKEKKLAAIGELGLDFFYDFAPREVQKEVFSEFLDIAVQWDKPAIVHLRDRENSEAVYRDALEILGDFSGRGGRFVIHCYTGGEKFLPDFVQMGAYFGVTGMATFRRADAIREQLKKIPPEKLLLETDSPYLAPVPLRGTENTPGNLPFVAACAAQVLEKTIDEIAGLTTGNARRFFRF